MYINFGHPLYIRRRTYLSNRILVGNVEAAGSHFRRRRVRKLNEYARDVPDPNTTCRLTRFVAKFRRERTTDNAVGLRGVITHW